MAADTRVKCEILRPDPAFPFTIIAPETPETGEIVVYVPAHDVYTFTPEGRRLRGWRLPFPAAPRCGIAVDAAGHLYTVGDQDRRVHKLDAAGRVLTSFGGGRGEGDGQLFDPIAPGDRRRRPSLAHDPGCEARAPPRLDRLLPHGSPAARAMAPADRPLDRQRQLGSGVAGRRVARRLGRARRRARRRPRCSETCIPSPPATRSPTSGTWRTK